MILYPEILFDRMDDPKVPLQPMSNMFLFFFAFLDVVERYFRVSCNVVIVAAVLKDVFFIMDRFSSGDVRVDSNVVIVFPRLL